MIALAKSAPRSSGRAAGARSQLGMFVLCPVACLHACMHGHLVVIVRGQLLTEGHLVRPSHRRLLTSRAHTADAFPSFAYCVQDSTRISAPPRVLDIIHFPRVRRLHRRTRVAGVRVRVHNVLASAAKDCGPIIDGAARAHNTRGVASSPHRIE